MGGFAGINRTGFVGDNPLNGSFISGTGYELGAVGEFFLSDDIAVNINPMVSSRSSGIEYDVPYQYEPYDSIRIDIDYFEIPLNLKVIADNNISYVTAGLIFAIPINPKATNNRSGNQIELQDQFESYVWTASFGVGIQFSIGNPMMFVELSYTQSLTNLNKITIKDVEINYKLKSSSFQLNTGILFTL